MGAEILGLEMSPNQERVTVQSSKFNPFGCIRLYGTVISLNTKHTASTYCDSEKVCLCMREMPSCRVSDGSGPNEKSPCACGTTVCTDQNGVATGLVCDATKSECSEWLGAGGS